MRRIIRVKFIVLLVACGWSVSSCDKEKSERAEQGREAVSFKRVEGDGWSLEVPADWTPYEGRSNIYVGPDRANVVVNVREVPLPLELITDSTKQDLEERLEQFELLKETRGRIGDQLAYELRGSHVKNDRRVMVTTVVVEGGAVKYVLTLSVVKADYPGNEAIFQKIVKSFEGTHHPTGEDNPDSADP